MLKDFNGQLIQEGFYLDSFGHLVHVKRDQGDWEYSDDGKSYISLGGYSNLLLGRIKNPDQAADMIRQREGQLAQITKDSSRKLPQKARDPVKVVVTPLGTSLA